MNEAEQARGDAAPGRGIVNRLPPPLRRLGASAARLLYAVGRDATVGRLDLHASGLSYTTLVAIVPLLALSFSVLKGLGADQELGPLLLGMLAPLGGGAQAITDGILGFVSKVEAGILGAFGLAVLAYTAISVVSKVEQAFNQVWRVRKERTYLRMFTDYLSVLMVGPLLLVASLRMVGALRGRAEAHLSADGAFSRMLVDQLLGAGPYVVLLLAFTGLYLLLPNTNVRLRPAALGALIAGSLWIGAGKAFAAFVEASTSYTAIYSAFASSILFLIWLQLNWLILLIGASVAFYLQNPAYLHIRGPEAQFSARTRIRLGLAVLAAIVNRQYRGVAPASADQIARQLKVPKIGVDETLTVLTNAGLLTASSDTPPRYVLIVAAETTSLSAAVAAIRGYGEAGGVSLDAVAPGATGVATTEKAIEEAIAQALAGHTLKDLADATASTQG